MTAGCGDTEEGGGMPGPDAPEPDPQPATYPLTISEVRNIPEGVSFDRLAAQITGVDWSLIATVEAPFEEEEATLGLPLEFPSENLQVVDRRNNNMAGYWPGIASDPAALVATLGDIVAYRGDEKVGRVYRSDWSGEESSATKAFVYYQYADRTFEVTGSTKSDYYSDCTFVAGWNAFANINPASESSHGNIRCTTAGLDERELAWNFESWVH